MHNMHKHFSLYATVNMQKVAGLVNHSPDSFSFYSLVQSYITANTAENMHGSVNNTDHVKGKYLNSKHYSLKIDI